MRSDRIGFDSGTNNMKIGKTGGGVDICKVLFRRMSDFGRLQMEGRHVLPTASELKIVCCRGDSPICNRQKFARLDVDRSSSKHDADGK